ncbi:MCP four helix bundle domain-containing protein [Aquincola sp. S2]|uniref:MCP four helix bundle domain-containing protein n=1 Tax=Pseudaquabacterium terrae TaxID=2732868 RepID=A0ABX2EJV0_9BURK|nr:methyl-accepting chemotaxis protein [Aquabacterium terrae]NRF68937.1 MCP four helix bundle domain-containing protein [Aquabacterium terrae]
MNFIRNWRIGARLGAGFAIVLSLSSGMLAVAVTRLDHIGEDAAAIIDKEWVKAEAAATLYATARGNAQRTMQLFFTDDKRELARLRELIAGNRQTVTEAVATLDKLVYLPEGVAILGRLKERRGVYVESFSKVDRLLAQGQRDEATKELTGQTLPAIEALQVEAKALSELQSKIVTTAGAGIEATIDRTHWLLIALGAASVLLGAGFAWWLTRSITRPIGEAVRVAETVAAGDLSSRIEVRGRDETAQLLAALARMNSSLAGVVGTVRRSSDSIATGSGQIAVGNQDLSQRTEEQASSLQQTAASMEQLNSAVQNTADSARQVAQLARSATEAAQRGGGVVTEMVQTMDQISDASRRIGDIIGVIDGIAFQTNILALNAAVEAARAGEQGRGFAVVAAEVRTLAQRSGAAAREIKTLIGASAEKVELGSAQAGSAGQAMGDIVAQVRRVDDLIAEITAATLEQSTGLGQVGTAIGQLDEVTQQNAALVEESAAAAESLRQQAQRLVEAVAVFRLDEAAPQLA